MPTSRATARNSASGVHASYAYGAARAASGAAKAPVLREYLRRWSFEVGQSFEGLDKNASADQFAAVGPGFPVFRLADQ